MHKSSNFEWGATNIGESDWIETGDGAGMFFKFTFK